MKKYSYVTKVNKDGQRCRYRWWWEKFKDMDTGKSIKIKRHKLIKIDGERVRWISDERSKP